MVYLIFLLIWFSFLNFILFLNYHILIILGDFTVIIPYMSTVYFEDFHPHPFQAMFGGTHYAVFISIYGANFHPLHPSVSFPFPLSPPIDTLINTLPFTSGYVFLNKIEKIYCHSLWKIPCFFFKWEWFTGISST
jgi:hypothetical protein